MPSLPRSSVFPEDLKYTSEHEWLREPGQAEGSVRVGITDYAQDALGDIVFVQLPEVGETVTAGAVVGELESTKSVSEVYAPVGGEVVARNEALDATPELVNTDPYGDGWLFEIVPDNSGSSDLMDAADLPGGPRGLSSTKLRSGSHIRLLGADRLTPRNPEPPVALQGCRIDGHSCTRTSTNATGDRRHALLLAVREPELRQRAVLLAVWHAAEPARRPGERGEPRRLDRDHHLRGPAGKSEADERASLNPADAAAVDALPRGSALLVVQRGPGRRQPLPPRLRPLHGRAVTRERHLPRRHHRLPAPRRVPARRPGELPGARRGQPQRHLPQR